MKKIYLFLLALLCTVGAWAQSISSLSDLSNDKVYYLKTKRGSLVYNSNNANVLCTTKAYGSIDPTTTAGQWAIYKHNDQYYLYSVGGNKFVCSTNSGGFPLKENDYEPITILESGNADYPFAFTFDGKGSIDHNNNGNAPGAAYWGDGVTKKGTDGTAHQIIEAADMPSETAALIEKKIKGEFVEIGCTLTDDFGHTYTTSLTTFSDVLPAANAVSGCTLTDIAWTDDNHTAITAKVNYPFTLAPKPTMIKVCGGNGNSRWYADGESVKSHHNVQANPANLMNYMWEVTPAFADGAFTYTIKNLGNGKYIFSESTANNHDVGTVTFGETGSALACEISSNYFQLKLATGKYLSVNSPANQAAQILGTWSPHDGTQMANQTPDYDVAISDVDVATLYTPFAVTIPANVQAKYIKAEGNDLEDAWLTYSPVEGGIIPANTAVVLTGTEAAHHFTMSDNDGTAISDNLLFGFEKETAAAGSGHEGVGAEGTVYALTSKDGQPVFGHYVGENFSAGKAYLDVAGLGTSASRIDFFMIGEGTTDNINGISAKQEHNGAMYDLSGRRVKGVQKGIYIINGKKVIK